MYFFTILIVKYALLKREAHWCRSPHYRGLWGQLRLGSPMVVKMNIVLLSSNCVIGITNDCYHVGVAQCQNEASQLRRFITAQKSTSVAADP